MELIRVSRTYLANSHENLLALTYCLDNNNNNDKNIYLSKNRIYSNYKKEELHYPIGAIQKGLKPHTKIGIKRILKKNLREF